MMQTPQIYNPGDGNGVKKNQMQSNMNIVEDSDTQIQSVNYSLRNKREGSMLTVNTVSAKSQRGRAGLTVQNTI